MKRRLDSAAVLSGRSQSAEAEHRLERSFAHQDLVLEAMELAYGRGLAGALEMLARAMRDAGSIAGFWNKGRAEEAADWLDDGYPFDQAAQAAVLILEALRPLGARDPTGQDALQRGKQALDVGSQYAAGVIKAVGNPDALHAPRGELVAWAERPRQMLSAKALERLKQAVPDRAPYAHTVR